MNLKPVPLSSLAAVCSGGGAPQDPAAFSNHGHPFVRAGSLIKLLNGAEERSLEKLEPSTASKYGLKLFPTGTVLFAKSGMSATKGYIYRLQNPAYVVNHLAALIPHTVEDGTYLFHALQFFSPTNLIKDPSYPSIRLVDIENMMISAPNNVNEKNKISDILFEANAIRRMRLNSIIDLDNLKRSIFIDMFGDPISNEKNWDDHLYLGNVAELVSGVTKGRKLNGSLTREVPYLAVANVQDKALNLENVKTIQATNEEISRYRLVKDDLLLTEGGDPDKLGRGTLWNNEIEECIHQNHIFRVRLKSNLVQPIFLNWLIGSQRGKAYFLRSAKQTTGIASINMTQLRGFPLLVPPVPLQQKFSDLIAEIETLKTDQLTHLKTLDDLFSSLQHRAFRGEL